MTNLHFFSLIENSSSYIYHTPKQRKIKFKPESKLNDDIHTDKYSLKKSFVNVIFELIEFEFISIFPALITLTNSQTKKIHYIDLAGFFKTLLPSSFFYNFIKTESVTTAFFLFASFLSPRYVYFSLLFLSWCSFSGLSDARNLPFWLLVSQTATISAGMFSKITLDIQQIPVSPLPSLN